MLSATMNRLSPGSLRKNGRWLSRTERVWPVTAKERAARMRGQVRWYRGIAVLAGEKTDLQEKNVVPQVEWHAA